MYFAWLIKANPYRDELGRFASEGGAAMTLDTGGSGKAWGRAKPEAHAPGAFDGDDGALAIKAKRMRTILGDKSGDASAELWEKQGLDSKGWPARIPKEAPTQTLADAFAEHAKEVALPFKEKEAVEVYQGQSYEAMNALMRGKANPDPYRSDQEIQEDLEHLKSAVQKGRLPATMTMYRGIGTNDPDRYLASLKAGKKPILSDDSFSSVTYDPTIARRFAAGGGKGHQIIMEFDLPKGTPGHAMTDQYEREFLLPPGAAFKIDSMEKTTTSSGRTIYTAKASFIGHARVKKAK